MDTKKVVATGIGAALYAILSAIAIPLAPNTSLRIAIVIIVIFAALYGPTVGFLVGFIGHALNDLFMYGSVWWSWVFLSAVLGLVLGLIALDKTFNIKEGLIETKHIIKLYILGLVGVILAAIPAFCGDVFLYGEPASKSLLQITVGSITNLLVIYILGIPIVIFMAKRNQKSRGLDA